MVDNAAVYPVWFPGYSPRIVAYMANIAISPIAPLNKVDYYSGERP